MERKKYIAEFLGTFTLVFVGAGCVCANSYLVKAGSPGFGLLGIAIAFGVVVVAIRADRSPPVAVDHQLAVDTGAVGFFHLGVAHSAGFIDIAPMNGRGR